MPQASDADRAWAREKFGDIEPNGPEQYLKDHGFMLGADWVWITPKPMEDITKDEWACIAFLIHEWDYGDVRLSKKSDKGTRKR